MNNSIHDPDCLDHLYRSHQLCVDLKFDDAAQELLRADRFAKREIDTYWCRRQKEQLVQMHGIDWHKALKLSKATPT